MSGGESRRREFIPAIRDMIVQGVPGAPAAIQAAIDDWRDGKAPNGPFDAGVFAVCEKIAQDLDAQAEAEPDLDDLEEDVAWLVTFVREDGERQMSLEVHWPAGDRIGAGRKAERHVREAWKGDWKVLSIDRRPEEKGDS